MRESPLKIAVLGLNDTGRLMLEAAKGFDCFTIAAVGDNDTNLAQQVAKEHNCAAYDDYRQLIIAEPARLPVRGGPTAQLRRIPENGDKKEVSHP